MNHNYIYLAGACEAYEGTVLASQWRKKVKEWIVSNCSSFRCINPMDYYSYSCNYHRSDTEVFRFYLHKVRKSDVILVNLNDIRKSIGTCIEVYEAFRNGIPVVGFINSNSSINELKNEIHTWIYECCNRIECGEHAMENALSHIKDFFGE